MSVSTTCDICGEVIDPTERIGLRVDDQRLLPAGSNRKDTSPEELRTLAETVTRRAEEVLLFSRHFDVHVSCYREHIEPTIVAAFRLEKP